MSLTLAIQQIQFARDYTLRLLAETDDADWYRLPAGCPTHIAWQVGHLAMAEYGLCLFRQRGRQEIDREIMPSEFRKAFTRSSQPETDPAKLMPVAEIRAIFDRVHVQFLQEAPTFSDNQLKEPVEPPFTVEATKLGSLYFCSHHEMLHAGQIGLLRRLLGKEPVR